LLEDGDVGVGVFPEGEEILVGGECPDAGGIGEPRRVAQFGSGVARNSGL
jgi:hypothetical protein